MANSISLSTDMKTLYFTDSSGFAQAFSLAGNGVYITTIKGDVHVVTATTPLAIGSDDFDIGVTSQWDATFHENTTQAMMIGSDDIEPGVTAEVTKFDLSNGNVVNLRLNSAQTKILART